MSRLLLLSDSALFGRVASRLVGSIDATAELLRHPHDDGLAALQQQSEEDEAFVRVLIDLSAVDEATALARFNELTAGTDLPIACVLDAQHDDTVDALMDAGATAVIIKSATPQALVAAFELVLAGETCRPTPVQTLAVDALPDQLRARLNGREQKLLRLAMGGTPVDQIARTLGMTEAKVVSESRRLSDLVRGRDGG